MRYVIRHATATPSASPTRMNTGVVPATWSTSHPSPPPATTQTAFVVPRVSRSQALGCDFAATSSRPPGCLVGRPPTRPRKPADQVFLRLAATYHMRYLALWAGPLSGNAISVDTLGTSRPVRRP